MLHFEWGFLVKQFSHKLLINNIFSFINKNCKIMQFILSYPNFDVRYYLTVSLLLQALLRMDKGLSKKRRLQRVEEVIKEVSE